jgi:DNA-binding response OmpR family regulator
MARALTSAGYQVLTATNGLEAIALSVELSRPPAALITDLRMEPIDGPSLARLIREQWPGIPLLFISARSPSVECGQLPGPLLLKPFYAAQLIGALTALISRADSTGYRPP